MPSRLLLWNYMIRHERENRFSTDEIVDEVKLIDFDRLIGDPGKIVNDFGAYALIHAGLDSAAFTAARDDAETQGTFDAFGYLGDVMNGDTRTRLLDEYAQQADGDSLLMPGAHEFLEMLEEADDPYCLFTTPTGEIEWQKAKIKATDLEDMPCWLTESFEKGTTLKSLFDKERGYFVLPVGPRGIKTRSIVLFDDKASSFDNFPSPPSRGYHVLDPSIARGYQKGEVPANVRHVKDLFEVIRLENERMAA